MLKDGSCRKYWSTDRAVDCEFSVTWSKTAHDPGVGRVGGGGLRGVNNIWCDSIFCEWQAVFCNTPSFFSDVFFTF